MTKLCTAKWLLLFAPMLLSCSKKSSSPPTQNSASAAPANPAASPSASAPSAPAPLEPPVQNAHGVKAEMRNVMFHLTPSAAAHLVVLSGELWPTGKNEMVVFDDKDSFEVRIANGTMAISPQALSDVMNNYVFAKKDAPLKDITVSINDDQLIIKGKLHSKGDLPFGTSGTLSVNDDGRLRLRTQKITALHVPVKGLMSLFGIELAKVMNTSKIDGIDADKNDLLMDLSLLLPPPHIRGKVVAVHIEKNAVVTIFGDGGKSLPTSEKHSYMAFSGNAVKFGHLVMDPANLTVLDLDPAATLDWDQDHYRQQLEAGYSKLTPTFGLEAYAKDYSKLPRTKPAATPSPSAQ
ncbi:MAG: hypothetical protein WBR26_27695 [Candidatus Acidiferrum sp.]